MFIDLDCILWSINTYKKTNKKNRKEKERKKERRGRQFPAMTEKA